MEVKPGYKLTEVGVIPEEWEITTLGDVCKIFGRIGFRGYTVNDIVEKGYGAIAISPSNIKDNKADFTDCTYISWFKYEESPEIKIFNGDILLVKTGSTFGKTAVVQHLEEKATLNPQVVVLKQVKINNFFLGYMMGFKTIQNQVSAFIVGGAVPTLSQSFVSKFKFPLPPLAEQEAIAAALSDADALIESLEQLIAKKRQVKQGAMQELLTGKRRLPGFSGEWEVKRLGDVCRITTGKKDVNEGNPDGQFPFFTCSRTHTYSDSYSFDTEAIMIAGNGDVGNLHYYKGKFEAYQRTYVLSDFTTNVNYLWQQLSTYLADSLGLGKIGSSIPYIKKENLINFEFNSPRDEAEQTAIAAILSDMDAELFALEAKLVKARQVKQGMMQELLTGRIRLV